MEVLLGKEHEEVQHSLIPYAHGGWLDLYYYPHGIPGTGVATKELIDERGKGPGNARFKAYELVMFTRQELDLTDVAGETTAFGKANEDMVWVLTLIARYGTEASLNPFETLEFPADFGRVGGKCFILDSYDPKGTGFRFMNQSFGLLLVMEVFRSEMKWAMENGGAELIGRLKDAGVYPYSDLDRSAIL